MIFQKQVLSVVLKQRLKIIKHNSNSNYAFLGKDAKVDITGEYISNKKLAIKYFEYYSKYISINGEYNIYLNHKLNGNFHFLANNFKLGNLQNSISGRQVD